MNAPRFPRAIYPMHEYIASFDFFNWLVQAKAQGFREIVFFAKWFKAVKWDEATVRRRFQSILVPGVALAGLTYSLGRSGTDIGRPHMKHLLDYCWSGGKFERLKTVKPAGAARYTVTIRNTQRRPERNSREDDWRRFAEEIGAVVIEDYDVKPIHLHDRVALYAGAEMNFGVVTGPLHLCTLTPYPVLMFGCALASGGFTNCGMTWGSNYPWCGPDQRLIWDDDTLANLRKYFDQWQTEKANRPAA